MCALTIARFVPVGSRLQPFFFAAFRIAASDSPCAPAMVRSESTPARYAPSIAIQSTFFPAMVGFASIQREANRAAGRGKQKARNRFPGAGELWSEDLRGDTVVAWC